MKNKFSKYSVMSGVIKEGCVTAYSAREALEKAIQHEGYVDYEIEAITPANEGQSRPSATVKLLNGGKVHSEQFYINLNFKTKRKSAK